MPAQQRLEGFDALTARRHLRLIMQRQFPTAILIQQRLQASGQMVLMQHLVADFLIEELIAIAPGQLGTMLGDIGIAHQLGRLAPILGIQADADTQAQQQLAPFDLEGSLEVLTNALDHRQGITLVIQSWHRQHEFIATKAREQILIALEALQTLGHATDDAVTHLVTEGVIDLGEMIDIEKQHHQGVVMTLTFTERLAEFAFEGLAIGQLRQGVETRHVIQITLDLALTRQIDVDTEHQRIVSALSQHHMVGKDRHGGA